jgi:hypothetical protein
MPKAPTALVEAICDLLEKHGYDVKQGHAGCPNIFLVNKNQSSVLLYLLSEQNEPFWNAAKSGIDSLRNQDRP